jgi:hypothetical protein
VLAPENERQVKRETICMIQSLDIKEAQAKKHYAKLPKPPAERKCTKILCLKGNCSLLGMIIKEKVRSTKKALEKLSQVLAPATKGHIIPSLKGMSLHKERLRKKEALPKKNVAKLNNWQNGRAKTK